MVGTKILEERKSKFNGDLRVVKTWGMGTYIQAGGLTQSGGIVESIWKSTLKEVKKQKSKIKNVLILGLGGGTLVKLIKKNWPETKIIGVDIDPIMVELGKKYLGLNTADVKIIVRDAYDHCLIPNAYDLVIVDLYNGDRYPEKFATDKFLKLILKLLSKGGIAIFNRLYFGNKRPEAIKFGLKLKKIFKSVEYYYPKANLMYFVKP